MAASDGLELRLHRRYKDGVEFRILGPLEVANGDGSTSIEAAKPRALLGVLLLHPNEVVSSDRLIDELWGEQRPATAAKLVQTYVSQLRRTLDPEAIVTRPPGYELRVADEQLDARRFRRLTAAARSLAAHGEQERAEAVYGAALSLWRGPALADVAFESFARNEVERLEEERLGAVMERIDCELALGRHNRVVAELEELVGQYPFRERLWAQLMLALYRSGRQADALAAYRDARRTLVDELGLEPGRELQELEKAILSHAASLQAAAQPLRQQKTVRARGALVVALAVLAVALALGLMRARAEPLPLQLGSNSVGFIDAESGRLTRSFPVGRAPRALAVAFGSVWAASYAEGTVTRIDRRNGRSIRIRVGDYPTAIAAHEGIVWVATAVGRIFPVNPHDDIVGKSIDVNPPFWAGSEAELAVGSGFFWLTVPPKRVLRIDPTNARRVVRDQVWLQHLLTLDVDQLPTHCPLSLLRRTCDQLREGRASDRVALLIVPDFGARGPIEYRAAEAWVAGSATVFPIASESGAPQPGIWVGPPVRDLVFAEGSVWVVSGGAADSGTFAALRRADPRSGRVVGTIRVGNDPVAVAAAGGSIWVASRRDNAVIRVDPTTNDVVDAIPLGARPTALAADENGVWVAVE